MQISPLSFPALIMDTLKRLFADEAIPLAGNIAFRLIFSIFPFLIFLTSLAGFFGSSELAQAVVSYLLSVAPEQLIRPLAPEISSILTVPRSGLLSLSALLTIWSAMGGVDSIRVALNRAYDLKDMRPFWYLYLQNVLFVVGAAALLLAVAVLLVIYPLLVRELQIYAPSEVARFASLNSMRYPLAIGLLLIGLQVAHQVLPAQAPLARTVFPGVLLTVIVWTLLSTAFSFYLTHFNSFASTYASLSGIFAAMLFVYQAALVLIFGGEFNRVLSLLKA
jgi:membrane protein